MAEADVPEFWSNWNVNKKSHDVTQGEIVEQQSMTDQEKNIASRQAHEARIAAEEAQTETPAQLIERMKTQIESNRNAIMDINFELSAFDSKMKAIEEEEARLLERKRKIKQEKSKFETRRFDTSRANRELEEEIERLKRKLALEAAAAEAAKKESDRRQSLDELTAKAYWRDRALPHQLDGMHFIAAAQRVICADEMGTGKTLQAIMSLDAWQAMGDSKGIVLLIAPGDLCDNFMVECDKWAPERLVINCANLGTAQTLETLDFYGQQVESGAEEDITILINYEILPRSKPILNELVAWQFDSVICDEAHRMKATTKATFAAVKKIVHSYNTCPECGELCSATHASGRMDLPNTRKVHCPTHGDVYGERSVKNYMSMTGTPILNKPEEIFASLHLCRDDLFPDLNDFRYQYTYKTYDGKYMWTTGGESRLVNKIKGMYLRRSIADAGITLPPQDIQVHDIKLDPVAYKKQAEILTSLVRDAQIRINEKEAVGVHHVMALITRQRQATVWPGGIKLKYYDKVLDVIEERYVGDEYLESQKLDWACDLMDEFDESGIRYVVFSQFREPLIELGKRRGNKVVEFHGGTPINQRADIKRNFDRSLGEKPKWNGVLAHYRLGGEGLNLTAATQTIILDEQWSPGMNTQAYKRTQRMGQTEDTGVHIGRLIGKGSLDNWMAELIAEKAKMIDGFDTEITFAQLAELFEKSA